MNVSKNEAGGGFAALCEAFGTTPGKGRMLVMGVLGSVAGFAVFFTFLAGGASRGEALAQARGGFWPGSVLIAPGLYDMICKGWSLDHHAGK